MLVQQLDREGDREDRNHYEKDDKAYHAAGSGFPPARNHINVSRESILSLELLILRLCGVGRHRITRCRYLQVDSCRDVPHCCALAGIFDQAAAHNVGIGLREFCGISLRRWTLRKRLEQGYTQRPDICGWSN